MLSPAHLLSFKDFYSDGNAWRPPLLLAGSARVYGNHLARSCSSLFLTSSII